MTQHNSPHAPKRTVALATDTRIRRAPDWAQHAARIAPAIGVRTPIGQQRPAAYTWGTAEQRAWWQNASARTAALAAIAVLVSAAFAGAAVIARGDVR